jgi:hypothetical protein
MNTASRCVIVLLSLGWAVVGCSRAAKEMLDTVHAPVTPAADSLRPRMEDGREGMPASWYRAGSFVYDNEKCFFHPPNPPPATHTRLEFECGIIAMGLVSGMRANDVADLLPPIRGSILRDHSGGPFPALVIRIPVRTELAAVLHLLDDPRVRYASFNWRMGVAGN